jgi:hypothetical protein
MIFLTKLMARGDAASLRWYATLLVLIANLALGFWGYAVYDRRYGHEPQWAENAVATFGLLSLKLDARYEDPIARAAQTNAPHDLPWQLRVASAIMPLLYLTLFLVSIALIVGKDLTRATARWRRGHTIVTGPPERVAALTRSRRGEGERIVVLAAPGTLAAHGEALGRGVVGLEGEAASPAALRRAGLEGAAALFALDPSGARNLEILLVASRLPRTARQPLRAYGAFPLGGLGDTLGQSEAGLLHRSDFDLRVLMPQVSLARRLVAGCRADALARLRSKKVVEIAVLGGGGMARALADAVVTLALYPAPARTRLLLIVPEGAPAWAPAWLEAADHLRACSAVEVRHAVAAGPWPAAALAALEPALHAQDAIFVCGPDDDGNMQLGLDLRARMRVDPGCVAPLHLQVGTRSDLDEILNELPGADLDMPQLTSFGDDDGLWGEAGLVDEPREALARAIHRAYLDKHAAGASRVIRPWDELSEAYRNANRAQADHLPVKLAALGQAIGRARIPAPAGSAAMAPDAAALEAAARLEHRRWSAERLVAGWRPGEVRDLQRRRHQNLVPYEALPEADKAKDRETVLDLTAVLSHAGRTPVPWRTLNLIEWREEARSAAAALGDWIRATGGRVTVHTTLLSDHEVAMAKALARVAGVELVQVTPRAGLTAGTELAEAQSRAAREVPTAGRLCLPGADESPTPESARRRAAAALEAARVPAGRTSADLQAALSGRGEGA